MTQESQDSVEESHVCQKKKSQKSDRPTRLKKSRPRDDTGRFQPDQALINNHILIQLDAIGKHLTTIEKIFGFCCPALGQKVVSRSTCSLSLCFLRKSKMAREFVLEFNSKGRVTY